MRRQLQRGFRFGVTGVMSTAIHFLVALLCLEVLTLGFHSIEMGPVLANGVAFVTATLFSYVLNTRWSFSKPMHGNNFRRYMFASLFGLVAAMLLARFAELLGWSPLGGITLVVCVMPFLNFGLHSFWTYR